MYSSLEAVENSSNDIHTDATARNFRYFRSSAEARFENKIEGFLIGQTLGLFGFNDSFFNGVGAQLSGVHATAIIANFNDHLRALVISVEVDGATRGLSNCKALVGRLDTMIHGVADEVHERFSKRVKNALVEIRVLARK